MHSVATEDDGRRHAVESKNILCIMRRKSVALMRKLTAMASTKRQLRFHVQLCIQELTHIPLESGTVFVKVKTNEVVHETTRQRIQNHTVRWGESFEFEAPLDVDQATNIVESFAIRLSIRQEANSASFERIGVVVVDLAEYVSTRESTRRYLLAMCTSNSSLKISVRCRQTAGDPMFRARASVARMDEDAMLAEEDQTHSSIFSLAENG